MDPSCLHCGKPLTGADPELTITHCPGCGEQVSSLAIPQQSAGDTGTSEHIPSQLGRYQILREIGRGGFSVVCLAIDSELKREVAVKIPRRQSYASPEDYEAVFSEARLLARVSHSGILPVYDVGTDQGIRYIVTKYIDGTSLREFLRKGRPAFAVSARILLECAQAVQAMHRHQIYHRDLKPGNVLIDRQGHAWIADFGLAIERDTLRGNAFAASGTPRYMSPEQVRGDVRKLDGRSDIWSLGIILYRLLTEHEPFGGEGAALCREILEHEPPPLRQHDETIPVELESICLKCLAKSPGDRFSTAHDLAQALDQWLRQFEAANPSSVNQNSTIETEDTADNLSTRAFAGVRHAARLRHGQLIFATGVLVCGLTVAARFDGQGTNLEIEKAFVQAKSQLATGNWVYLLDLPRRSLPGITPCEPATLLSTNGREHFLGPTGPDREYTLSTSSEALVSFGDLNSDNFRLSVRLDRDWSMGGAGIFFGYQPAPSRGHGILQQCTHVSLHWHVPHRMLPYKGSLRIGHLVRHEADGPQPVGIVPWGHDTKQLLEVDDSNLLELVVSRGQLMEVYLNRQLLYRYDPGNPECWNREVFKISSKGKFGLYVKMGAARFSDFRIRFPGGR